MLVRKGVVMGCLLMNFMLEPEIIIMLSLELRVTLEYNLIRNEYIGIIEKL